MVVLQIFNEPRSGEVKNLLRLETHTAVRKGRVMSSKIPDLWEIRRISQRSGILVVISVVLRSSWPQTYIYRKPFSFTKAEQIFNFATSWLVKNL